MHAVLLLADLLAVWGIRARDEAWPLVATLWLASVGGFGFVSGYHQGDLFLMMAIVGQGLFVHGPPLLWVSAAQLDGTARVLLAALSLPLMLVGVDAYLVEPTWLEVAEYELIVPDAPRALTIAVLADVQTDGLTRHERRAVERALDAKPDLILFPGDLVQSKDPEAYAHIQAELAGMFVDAGLDAPLGMYAVDGNVDTQRNWTPAFAGSDVHTVDAGVTHFEPEPGIHVTALPFADGFDTGLRLPDRDGLHIVFAHGPDFALGEVEGDLLVAGHVHGGQVRLPLLGPVMTLSRVPRDWAAGHTEIRPGTHLLVSRGVGMERHNAPRLRFNCRPEVMILRVRPS